MEGKVCQRVARCASSIRYAEGGRTCWRCISDGVRLCLEPDGAGDSGLGETDGAIVSERRGGW